MAETTELKDTGLDGPVSKETGHRLADPALPSASPCQLSSQISSQISSQSSSLQTPSSPASATITRLLLSHFRSYTMASLDLDPAQSLVVLTGENGAGKTNILEAISYLAPGRGLRGAALTELCHHQAMQSDKQAIDKQAWAVSAHLTIDNEPIQIGTGLDPDCFMDTGTAAKRIVRLSGENQSPSVLASMLSILWLTPQMDRLFTEAPSSRRNFLDRMVMGLYPDHGRQVSGFEKAMRERNKLLTDFGLQADSSWLKILEARMSEHAAAIAMARLDFTGQIAGLIEEYSDSTTLSGSAFPSASLALDGDLESQLNEGVSVPEVEDGYRHKLMDLRALDAAKGRATCGPHKTDLLVTHAPKNMPAALCSTGEQKALLVNLILANARLITALTGKTPLLLLDEIAAHLDDRRLSALFDALEVLQAQCWLTGTDKSLFKALDGRAQFYGVAAGKINPSSQAV